MSLFHWLLAAPVSFSLARSLSSYCSCISGQAPSLESLTESVAIESFLTASGSIALA